MPRHATKATARTPAAGAHPDRAHDPGFELARRRAEAVGLRSAEVIREPSGGTIRTGTAGWTDPTLTRGEVFYPKGVDTAEERLRYYASRFPMVEVDATYYALPARRMTELWAERTPDDFVFDVKAHALMTGHPTEVKRLPSVIQDALPAAAAEKTRVYAKDLPPEVEDAVWGIFLDALEPLRAAGKLGAVLLQYPRWFVPSRENADAILRARERLGDVRGAVEFRNRRWFSERHAERTLRFLADHGIPFVMVDEPQGLESSVPPLTAVTSPELAIVRLHGRRGETWEKRGVSVAEKFRYLYDRGQLGEWAPKVHEAAKQAAHTHVVFNNCYGNYGTTNALEMAGMLAGDGGAG